VDHHRVRRHHVSNREGVPTLAVSCRSPGRNTHGGGAGRGRDAAVRYENATAGRLGIMFEATGSGPWQHNHGPGKSGNAMAAIPW
jgi:hypothetical protein